MNKSQMIDHDAIKIKLEIVLVCPTCFYCSNQQGESVNESPPFPADLLVGMANNILSPIDWNVEFRAESETEGIRSLFVHRYVLSARSEYYKTSHFRHGVC